MAITGLTLANTKDFVSRLDDAAGTPDETVFKIGAIDLFVSTYVFDRVLDFKRSETNDIEAARVRMNEMDVELVRFGLKGIRNFKDAQGADIPFSTTKRTVLGRTYDVVADDVLTLLPIEIIRELSPAIRAMNTVTKADAKN